MNANQPDDQPADEVGRLIQAFGFDLALYVPKELLPEYGRAIVELLGEARMEGARDALVLAGDLYDEITDKTTYRERLTLVAHQLVNEPLDPDDINDEFGGTQP